MKFDQHTCILGTTDSGKTWYAVWLYLHLKGLRIFFNSAHEPIVHKYSQWEVKSGNELLQLFGSERAQTGKLERICYTPVKNYEAELIDLQKILFAIGAQLNKAGKRVRWCWLFIDEAHLMGEKKGYDSFNTFFTGGLRYGVVTIAIAQRPALLSHTALTQSKIHVYFNMEQYEETYMEKYGFNYDEYHEWIRQPYQYIVKRGTVVEKGTKIALR